MTRLRDELPDGQAAVLAALIRTAHLGPVPLRHLCRVTGFTRQRVRRAVNALHADDLIAHTDRGLVPRVRPEPLVPDRVYDGAWHESARATATTAPERAQQPSLERP